MNSQTTSTQRNLTRDEFCALLRKAIKIPQPRFVRQSAAEWLGIYPGDLQVQSFLAAAQIFEGKKDQAAEIAKKIIRIDPEFVEGYEILLKCLPDDSIEREPLLEKLYVLGGRVSGGAQKPEWVQNLRAARLSFINQQVSAADQYLLKAIGVASDNVLTAILHLQITRATADTQAVQNLASLYAQRWPETVLFSLYLAEAQMDLGSDVIAVNLLHECAAKDSAGDIPSRVWGKEHPYKSIWPEITNIKLTIPIPASLAAAMGWNQIDNGIALPTKEQHKSVRSPISSSPQKIEREQIRSNKNLDEISVSVGDQSQKTDLIMDFSNLVFNKASNLFSTAKKVVNDFSPQELSEDTRSEIPVQKIRDELAKVAIKLDHADIAASDHRFPILVLLSVRKGLEKQFGVQTFSVIDSELKNLAINTGKLPDWNARVIYVDDPDSTGKAGLNPVEATDPWKIKLLLADLDKVLAKKGEMIGSLILIGGPEIVPFHRLPNPTDDLDDEVLSDSPYATRDSNYFVPEWPVTRVPGGNGPDAGLLLEQIRRINQSVNKPKISSGFGMSDNPILALLKEFFNKYTSFASESTFGYSAEIWKQSSEEVFSQVNKNRSILTSPPVNTDSVPGNHAVSAAISYFNLHGLIDSNEWYGQKDMTISTNGPDYPVALKPDDLYRSGPDNGIVFTEACFGGHINGKDEDESIAIKFISTGSACVVGSTSTSYGSVSMPLIGADLLGYHFLQYLNSGQSTGESLYHAKLDFIREMQKRQGYLDGEDQKTLISFVMYGNPFATYRQEKKQTKSIHREKMISEVHAVCSKDHETEFPKRMGDETLAKIKQVVEPYLPGVSNALVHYSRVHTVCDGKNHTCPTSEIHSHNKSHNRSGKMVVSISKSYQSANRTHAHYARVTLDGKGKMIKLAISR
jgi:hypothetical protein